MLMKKCLLVTVWTVWKNRPAGILRRSSSLTTAGKSRGRYFLGKRFLFPCGPWNWERTEVWQQPVIWGWTVQRGSIFFFWTVMITWNGQRSRICSSSCRRGQILFMPDCARHGMAEKCMMIMERSWRHRIP